MIKFKGQESINLPNNLSLQTGNLDPDMGTLEVNYIPHDIFKAIVATPDLTVQVEDINMEFDVLMKNAQGSVIHRLGNTPLISSWYVEFVITDKRVIQHG